MHEFVKCVALVAVVRSTAQGMVVIDPEGPTEAHRFPKLRSDVAAIMADDLQVEIIGETTPPVTETAEDRAAAKKVVKDAAERANAERKVAKDPPAKNDGTQGAATTAHPPGATDGLRAADDGSPPLDDDDDTGGGSGGDGTGNDGAGLGAGDAGSGGNGAVDKVPAPSAIRGMNLANLTALAEAHGISFDDTVTNNQQRADAIIAVLHAEK